MHFINIADLKDPNDPQGRSYREINKSKVHAFSKGDLVETEKGLRAYIVKLGRDCDETPLYWISLDPNGKHHLWGGFPDDGLKLIKKDAAKEDDNYDE